MDHKKIMLVVNPVSGKGKVKNYIFNIIKRLAALGQPLSVFITEKSLDATDFVENYGSGQDIVICTGGDGTMHEVINGVMHLPLESRPVVGYIPLGTTNDMASSLKLPKTPEDVLDHIEDFRTKTIDIGQMGDLFFCYVAAFGAFTEVTYVTPQRGKNDWGYLAYLVQALSDLKEITPRHARIKYDEGEIEDNFLFGAIANSTSIAGIIKLDPNDVLLDDGTFELLLIKAPKNIIELSKVISNVLARNFNTDYVCLLHSREVEIEFDQPVSWSLDGEDGGSYQHVYAHNNQLAASLII